ncbi:MAG: GspE/PulE family protein [Armatimonadota bacterium]
MRRDVGEVLLQGRVITPEQLAQAREISEKKGIALPDVLLQQGIEPFKLLQANAFLHNMKAVDLKQHAPEVSAINVVPPHVARRARMIPVRKVSQNGQDVLVCAIADPNDVMALDNVRDACRLRVQAVLAPPEQIEELLDRHYPEGGGAPAAEASNGGAGGSTSIAASGASILGMVSEYTPTGGTDDDAGGSDDSDVVQGPIIRIAHAIIQEAVKSGASDIHIEPAGRNLRVRYRIDGVLHEIMQMPKYIHPPLTSRFKIMAELNIAERRIPQDGRIGINFQNKDYDLRVSVLPTQYGEKIVMRILDKSSVMLGLNKLGFFPDTLAQMERLITQPNGMFLSTGPTGAGKTTTQYSVLHRINSVEKNISTVEDPVEYQLPGVSQVQVHRKAGLTFATALRSLMRQDPDIIMVGEIRDLETAEMAIQASLTGHLVLSTLHTNDAPSAVTRLVDMGVEPFLVSATLIGANAQRLGRRICDQCKDDYEIDATELLQLGYEPQHEGEKVVLKRGRGCDTCKHTGYKGRIGIYELMVVNEEISDLMVRRAPVTEIRNAARANGMKTLKEDGLRKVLAGITTPEEVARVVFTAGH